MEDGNKKNPSSSTSSHDPSKNLWKVNVPSKVRLHFKRLCTNSLATRVRLDKRMIMELIVCRLCGV